MAEICARCGQPTETAHTWDLDGTRHIAAGLHGQLLRSAP